MYRVVTACVALAASGPSSCLALKDTAPDPGQPRFWMRSEAYQAAVAVAVARSDIDRNDPSLITRDFTRETGSLEGRHMAAHYAPCPLSGAELIGSDRVNCSLSPGVGGVKSDDPRCPWQTCVTVSVRSETWADPLTRHVILSTLADFGAVCAAARTYGPNKRFDAMAVGCDRQDRQEVQLAIEVKPRLFQPCVYEETKRGEHYFIRPACANRDATLIAVD